MNKIGSYRRRKTENDKEKTDVLAGFFASLFKQEPEKAVLELGTKSVPVLTFMEISRNDALQALKKLRRDKSPGSDGIRLRILTELTHVQFLE